MAMDSAASGGMELEQQATDGEMRYISVCPLGPVLERGDRGGFFDGRPRAAGRALPSAAATMGCGTANKN